VTLDVVPVGWRPSDRQLAVLASFLLGLARRERDPAARRPAAPTERAAAGLFEQQP
jgi:hypothetical protein